MKKIPPHIHEIHDTTAQFVTLELSIRIPFPHSAHHEVLFSLYAELLMAGCGTRSREAFLDELARLGSRLYVGTAGNMLTVGLRARSQVLTSSLTLLRELLAAPRFLPNELRRIQKRMSEELKLSTENARARAYEGIAARCYAPSDWRYAYDPHTLLREVSRVRMADIKKLHALVISSGSASATVGGTEADCHRVAKILRTLPSHVYQEPPSEPLHPPQGITTTLLDIPQKQNIEIVIGAPLPILRTHEDFPALFFGMRVLGYPRGFSGRLMSIVREKEGLTYGIYADLDGITAHTYGLWRITTFFAPKDVLRGITSTLREVERICTEGITEDELTRFKIMISTQLVMLNDSLISRVRTEHTRTLAGITPGEFESFKQAIARLSVDEVNAAMRTHIRAHNSIVSGAGPIRTVSHDIESLRGE